MYFCNRSWLLSIKHRQGHTSPAADNKRVFLKFPQTPIFLLFQLSANEKFLRTEHFACSRSCVCFYMWMEATKRFPYSHCEGTFESHTLMLCSTHYLPEANSPFPPEPSVPWELWHWPDLDCPMYILCLCLWMCCSRCHSDNMWIKLSLTHPLRKDIQVPACHATHLPSSLSTIKLIL